MRGIDNRTAGIYHKTDGLDAVSEVRAATKKHTHVEMSPMLRVARGLVHKLRREVCALQLVQTIRVLAENDVAYPKQYDD